MSERMKLEVGMYVRTKRDGIGRIISLSIGEEDDCCFIELPNRRTGIKERNILKASHNIIDLIEVGDYVNGYRVDYIENTNANNNFILQRIFCEEYEKDLYSKSFKPSDIKSIVTKEQFESMKYSLEG